jgi:hypothetical protein
MRAAGVGICVVAVCLGAVRGECGQRGAETAAAVAAAASGGYRIAGVVVDATTGTPVAGAELSISVATQEIKVTADGAGKFVFEGMEPGKYAVTAGAPGYVRERYNEHRGFSTAIALGGGLDSEHLVFRLHRQAVILGNVTDERGEAVRRAQVMLFGEQRGTGKRGIQMLTQTQTNDLGAYRFAHLLAGKYFVAVSGRPWYAQNGLRYQRATGRESGTIGGKLIAENFDGKLDVVYPTTFYPGVTDEHSAAELVVSAGETQEADVRLQAVPAMHVLLTNLPTEQPNGPGVGVGANEKIFGSYSTGFGVVSGPVAPGVYEVAGLPPGDVTLTLSENRHGEWESRTIHTSLSEGEIVDATGARTTATASVSGRVIFAEGSGAKRQGDVVLTGKEHAGVSRKLQKDGTFSFAGVEADTYEVLVNLGTAEEYVEGVTATGAKVSGREVKIEGAGEVQLVIRMGKGLGQVKGVVNVDGKAEGGVMVLLMPESRENVEKDTRVDQSDSDGTFTMGGIVPGRYVLLAIEDGWDLEWAEEGVLEPYWKSGQRIEIGANELKKVAVEGQKRK